MREEITAAVPADLQAAARQSVLMGGPRRSAFAKIAEASERPMRVRRVAVTAELVGLILGRIFSEDVDWSDSRSVPVEHPRDLRALAIEFHDEALGGAGYMDVWFESPDFDAVAPAVEIPEWSPSVQRTPRLTP